MAATVVTITKQTAGCTKNRLVYLVTSADDAGTVATASITNATLVADATVGGVVTPLAALIRDTVCDSDAKAFNLFWNNDKVQTHITFINKLTTQVSKPIFTFTDDGGTDRAQVNAALIAGETTGVLLTIEYRHSEMR